MSETETLLALPTAPTPAARQPELDLKAALWAWDKLLHAFSEVNSTRMDPLLASETLHDSNTLKVSSANPSQACFWCLRACPPENRCPHCNLVLFCSEDHLYFHRSQSSDYCYPFRLLDSGSEIVGRYVVATRDIDPLEIICEDRPIVVGPSRKQDGLVCVECFRPTDGNIRCPDCGFPICKEEVARFMRMPDQSWHKTWECPYFLSKGIRAADRTDLGQLSKQERNTNTPIAALTPLRLLLRSHTKSVHFHCPTVMEVVLKPLEKVLIGVLRDDFQWQASHDSETIDAIRKLSFNARSLDQAGNNAGTGLYARYSMINHKCIINAKSTVGIKDRFKLVTRAQVSIKQGEEINVRYVGANIGLPTRHIQMIEIWNFRCSCSRCKDPTDMGTYNSAILCWHCSSTNAYVLPLDGGLRFKCSQCQTIFSVLEVQDVIDHGVRIIRSKTLQSKDPNDFEECIATLQKLFHPRNFMVQQVRFLLFALLNQPDESVASANQLQHIVDLGQELLDLIEVVDAGYARNSGQILKDLIPAYKKLSDARFAEGDLSREEYKKQIDSCSLMAKKLIQCFKHERF